MDLFWIYYDLYRIYGQNTFSAITFDLNKISTCSFFCWTLWIQSYHADCTDPVNYSYSRNVGNLKNI